MRFSRSSPIQRPIAYQKNAPPAIRSSRKDDEHDVRLPPERRCIRQAA
jgi:hypothetical protein